MKLKNKIQIIISSIALIGATSGCTKFLNVMPVGQTTIPVLFSDMDGIRAAVPGAYSKMYDYYSAHFYLYPELTGDLINPSLSSISEGQANIYNFSSVPEEEAAPSAKIWSDIFESLANSNNALFYLPDLRQKYPQYVAELDVYNAELLFLRALAHFDLCRVYAQPYNYTSDASHLGVPVLKRTPGPDDVVARQSVKAVYEAIIDDLHTAKQIYDRVGSIRKANERPYFASKDAVQALLSRVYLYMGDWDSTILHANEVIARNSLALGANYTNMFFSLSGPETETIFRLNGLDKGSGVFSFYNFRTQTGVVQPAGMPSNILIQAFSNESDVRKSELMQEIELGSNFYYVTRKFDAEQIVTENNKQHVNPIVLRLSEVYLNRAEAYINKNLPSLAADDIKTIQARALNQDPSEIILPENDLSAMKAIVYEERIRELALEGHRLFDITRRKQDLVRDSGTTSAIKELKYPSDYFILPIPQRELDANPDMKPNPTVNN